jgi:transcriptional regulator with XRE-family HTH domain
MLTGEQIKKAIKESGLTLDDASTKLGISRQTLYINLSKAVADRKFIDNVKENLGTYLNLEELQKNPTNDFVAGIKETAMVADALKDQIIKSQEQIIKSQQQTIEALNGRIEDLNRTMDSLQREIERFSKETVVQEQVDTHKRRSA